MSNLSFKLYRDVYGVDVTQLDRYETISELYDTDRDDYVVLFANGTEIGNYYYQVSYLQGVRGTTLGHREIAVSDPIYETIENERDMYELLNQYLIEFRG